MNHMSHAAMVDMMPMTMNSTGGMVLTNNWRGVPIVFPGWLPTPEGIVVAGSGAHIGSCMALAVIGILFRCLAAWRARCERSWRRAQVNEYRERLPVALQEKHAAMPSLLDMPHPRFKLQVDIPRMLFSFVAAVIQYFLMLAVMTMVTSYFFSICLGLALGELFFGRYILHYA